MMRSGYCFAIPSIALAEKGDATIFEVDWLCHISAEFWTMMGYGGNCEGKYSPSASIPEAGRVCKSVEY